MSIIEDITILYESDDNKKKLEVIEKRTKERLNSLLGVPDLPSELEHIVFEITQKRFNRIGNEGMKSYSQEGLSFSFPDSDFDEFKEEIDNWKLKNDDSNTFGRFRLY